MANDETKKKKAKLKEGIDKMKSLLLVATSDQEKLAISRVIYGLEKKLEALSGTK